MLHLSPITCISETVSLFCVFYQTIDHWSLLKYVYLGWRVSSHIAKYAHTDLGTEGYNYFNVPK